MISSLNSVRMRLPSRLAVLLSTAALLTAGVAHAVTAPSLSITPATTTVTADQPVTFTVTMTNSDGTTSDVSTAATLSTDDPRGTIEKNVYQPGKVGSWSVQAGYQSLNATATVTVTPGAIQEIVINPNSDPEPTLVGTVKTFNAVAYDAQSNIVPDQTFNWSVVGDIGTISADGVFLPKTVGTGKVQAAVGTVSAQVSVAVNAAPVVNANTNTATTTTNTNTSTTNDNTNTSTNTNTDTTAPATTTTSCTTLKPWAWTLMLVLFLLVVAVLFALVPVTKVWPVIVALAASAVLAYIQRKYACDTSPWWAWVITLGTVALSAAALQFRPKQPPLQQ